jgi:spore germination protein KB
LNIEKGKISNLQLIFLIVGHLEGTVFLISFVTNLARHNTWLVILSSLVTIVPFVYIYALLSQRFPGLNFARINQIIYGRYLGIMISLFYLIYFFSLLSLTTRVIGGYVQLFFIMQETPQEIILIVFICACAYAVWNGIEVLGRIAPFIVTIISLIIISTTFILLPKMDFSNFLPLGELPLKNFIHSTQILAEIPLGTALSAYLSIAFTLNDHKRVARTFLSGLLLAAFFFIVITIRNTAVLGNTEAIFVSPTFQVSRLIHIGILPGMEILFEVGYLFGMFIYCSILFYSNVLFLSQILGLRTYSPLIFPLGCISMILGIILYPSTTAHLQSAQNVEIMFFFPFIFIFPPLSLLIAKIRNLPQKGCP